VDEEKEKELEKVDVPVIEKEEVDGPIPEDLKDA
jgi:hypothetical protein